MPPADVKPATVPEVIYEDSDLIAAYKPEGWLVHRSNIDRHETQFLLQYLRDQTGAYLYPIHRLDKPTSGVILFAKSSEVAARTQSLLESDAAVKTYIAVCRGYCPEEGVIDHPLPPVNDFKHQRKRPKADQPRQDAVTLFRRLHTIELPYEVDRYPSSRYSLVEIQLKTGRRHQIRRHFKHLSHPLIGCPKYGKSTHNRFFAEHFHCSRLLLHALELRLPHPVTGEPLVVREPPRGEFHTLLERFGWQL
ncbi:tRNA pseudouridine synthase C [Microbulbifer aggregans]|uniref:tRNA pseudouridine synthase C n=1 Tax=Microbulbifer aggregans TaxID=1769779 RepID=A0A1C9WAQ2_9GAMM|nr:pseudouridine synthase [Microbulbifer aggregans]AOS98236.1 tRNA pseudouridine synthase C [Microbulbifer aggregans]